VVGTAFVSYGVKIGIRSTHADGVACLLENAPPIRRPASSPVVDRLYSLVWGGPGPRRGVTLLNLLYANAKQLERTASLDKIRRAFDINVGLFVAQRAPRHVFVHAGVVGFESGAIVFPGKSFAGKTTLTRALLELGAQYVSDDFAVLDEKGRVVPWPQDLGIRDANAKRGTRGRRVRPADLGIVPVRGSLPVRLVVLTQYEAGSTFRPEPASPAESALGMLANAVPARKRPQAALASITRVVESALSVRSPRGEASEAARAILKLAAGD